MLKERVINRTKRSFLKALIYARKISIPGFDGIPLYDVLVLFYKAIANGTLTSRASAVAFNFFMAFFPSLIFLFTLIPYIPIANFQTEIFQLIRDVLPESTFVVVEETLYDILMRPRGGLLSLGFLMALIFSSNGLVSMMNAFDASMHTIVKRNFIDQRITSFQLLFILAVLITVSVVLIIVGQMGIDKLYSLDLLGNRLNYYLLIVAKWITILFLLFFAFSSLYFFAPAKKTRWRFISPGSTLTTILCILVVYGFRAYVGFFDQYNKVYGSIGALLVVLMLFYLVSLILLFGFELNNSLNAAKHSGKQIRLKRNI